MQLGQQLLPLDLRAEKRARRWPDPRTGMVRNTQGWRFTDHQAEAVDAFYRDLLWCIDLELDRVHWTDYRRHNTRPSPLAAMRDVARLWDLPSAENPLPRP